MFLIPTVVFRTIVLHTDEFERWVVIYAVIGCAGALILLIPIMWMWQGSQIRALTILFGGWGRHLAYSPIDVIRRRVPPANQEPRKLL